MAESYIKIMGYKFERVHEFLHVGSLVNEENHMIEEISR
jgi:hypothetical protein